MPAKYTEANRSIEGQNIYVSDQTVKATLAAVYMAMAGYPLNKTEYYANAADKAKEVMDGVNKGTYDHSLLSEWKDVFSYGKNHHNEYLCYVCRIISLWCAVLKKESSKFAVNR